MHDSNAQVSVPLSQLNCPSTGSGLAATEQSGSGLTAQEGEFIPFQHHEEWINTGTDEKQRIKELLLAMQLIKSDDRGVVRACEALALINRGRKGWSKHNLKTLYYAWVQTEDWRLLRRNYRHDSSLPADFTRRLCAMVLREHRSRKQAIERVRAAWRAGEIVPGYGTWRQWFADRYPDREIPKHFCGDYPEGWSDTNLRNQMPSRLQHAYATGGFFAAQRDLPHLIRDTSKLRPLELVVFDDFKTDIRVYAYNPVLKKWECVPCVGLIAIDVATRCIIGFGLLPRLTLPKRMNRAALDAARPLTDAEIAADEKTRSIAISRADLQLVLKGIFMRIGVPADYMMTLLVENAAAAVTDGLETALEIYFHGQVRVCRTAMLEHRTAANGFTERGGTPWQKGWVESAIRSMHDRAGNLPGQTGSLEQVNAPGDLVGRTVYTLAALDGMTPEQAAKMELPVLSVEQATEAYARIFGMMDQRGEFCPHRMQGFETIKVWRTGPGQEYQPISTLRITAGDDTSTLDIVDRQQSPRERWACLMGQVKPFVTVEPFVIALLAFTPKTKMKYRNGKLTFEHAGTGYTYLDLEGHLKDLSEGSKVIGYFDEQQPTHLYVTDLQGRPLGVLVRQNDKTDITDPAAIGAAQEVMRRFFYGQVANPVTELLADDRAKSLADAAHNDAERARLGLAPIPSSARPGASRAINGPAPAGSPNGDNAASAAQPAPRKTLTDTLARDAFAAPADRFAQAKDTAAAIAQATVQHNAQAAVERATESDKAAAARLVEKYAQEEDNSKYI